MTREALRRIFFSAQRSPGRWIPVAADLEARFVATFPRERWDMVAGFVDDGHTITNRAEASATSMAQAVREAVELLEGSPEK